MTDPAIRARGLTRSTSRGFRLDAVDLTLPRGHVMGFVGPNGAGKTTTIKAVLGLVSCSSGEVSVLGEPAPLSADVRRRVGVVLDQPFLAPDWPVARSARRVGRLYGNWDDARFTDLLERFDVPGRARVSELSRGQGMKLSTAMALSHHPDLLILDEPTSGLDPVSRADLVDILREFMTDEQHSVLFSTHITTDLDGFADFLAIIDDGRIAFAGPAEALQEEFAMARGSNVLDRRAAAALIGSENRAYGWEGLIRMDDSALFGPEAVIDTASTDDVIVHIARNHAATSGAHV